MSLGRLSDHARGTRCGDAECGTVLMTALSVEALSAMRVATEAGRIVWGPHRVLCSAPADPGDGVCSCGAEYLGEGWWWIPGGGPGLVRAAGERRVASARSRMSAGGVGELSLGP